MTRRWFSLFLAILLLVTLGCNRSATKPQGRSLEPYVSDSHTVGFDIESLTRENETVRLRGTYRAQGKLAKFGIEFGPTRRVESEGLKDFPMATGEGRFVAEAGSDATVLLSDLQKALEAKAFPRNVQRVQALAFTFVNLGGNLSQASRGGFNTDPPGGWTAMKIFIGEGEQEGEVFLNFNPAIAKGQFSIKDADYGDIVIKQLATVL